MDLQRIPTTKGTPFYSPIQPQPHSCTKQNNEGGMVKEALAFGWPSSFVMHTSINIQILVPVFLVQQYLNGSDVSF